MKKFIITAILFLFCSFTYSQDFEFSEYVDESESIVVPEIEDAISRSTSYTEIVIIAKDSGTTPVLPAWFTPAMNGLQVFFAQGTFGNFDYQNIVLKASENEAFLFPETYITNWPGNCWHVHS